jgi:hypothetical protein
VKLDKSSVIVFSFIKHFLFLAKLESEFASIHLQLSERYEEQSKNLHISQEKIIIMVDNIEEMRRRSENLLLVENKV